MKIEAEDFKAWLGNPVTEAVIRLLQRKAEECKAQWLASSWEQGQCDPLLLRELKAKEQNFSDLANLAYEDIENEE